MDASREDSDTWFQSFVNNISILSKEDDFRRVLDESTLPLPMIGDLLSDEPAGGLPGAPDFGGGDQGDGPSGRSLHGVGRGEGLCPRSPTVAGSPGYDQSFFQDFESNNGEKSAEMIQDASTWNNPDLNGPRIGPALYSPSTELYSEEILDVETTGFEDRRGGRRGRGGGEGGSNFSNDLSFGSRHDLPPRTSTSVNNSPSETSAFVGCSSLVSPSTSGALQRIPIPCEESSLFNISPTSPQFPLEMDRLTSPSPAAISTNLRVKTENCVGSSSSSGGSGLDARKERRRQQNRTAARRCRDRKKESLESMIKALEATNAENEQYQRLIVGLKTRIHLLTQELRRHQLQCGLDLNSLRSNSALNGFKKN